MNLLRPPILCCHSFNIPPLVSPTRNCHPHTLSKYYANWADLSSLLSPSLPPPPPPSSSLSSPLLLPPLQFPLLPKLIVVRACHCCCCHSHCRCCRHCHRSRSHCCRHCIVAATAAVVIHCTVVSPPPRSCPLPLPLNAVFILHCHRCCCHLLPPSNANAHSCSLPPSSLSLPATFSANHQPLPLDGIVASQQPLLLFPSMVGCCLFAGLPPPEPSPATE
jgi:hypothetical protein